MTQSKADNPAEPSTAHTPLGQRSTPAPNPTHTLASPGYPLITTYTSPVHQTIAGPSRSSAQATASLEQVSGHFSIRLPSTKAVPTLPPSNNHLASHVPSTKTAKATEASHRDLVYAELEDNL